MKKYLVAIVIISFFSAKTIDNNAKGFKYFTGSDTPTYNLVTDFHALHIGLAGFDADTTAFGNAIRFLKTVHGYKKLYIPGTVDPANNFYCWAGTGLVTGDSIRIYGDGSASHIVQVDPDLGNGFHGALFLTCTYSNDPDETMAANSDACSFAIKNASKGDTYVIIKADSNLAKVNVRMLVCLGGRMRHRNYDPEQPYFSQIELNSITRIAHDTCYLQFPLTTNLFDSPVLIDVNSPFNTIYFGNVHNIICRNVQIDHLKITQSSVNMLDNDAPLTIPVGAVIKCGGLQNKFQCLTLDCYSALSANLITRTDMSFDTIYATKKLIDFGYGSSNTRFHDIVWNYQDSPAKDLDSDNAFAFMDEGSHGLCVDKINARGNWNQLTLMHVGNSTYEDTISNGLYDLPAYNDSLGRGIELNDGDTLAVAVRKILITNNIIRLQYTRFAISLFGEPENGGIKNRQIAISNNFFYGTCFKFFYQRNFGFVPLKNTNFNNIKQ